MLPFPSDYTPPLGAKTIYEQIKDCVRITWENKEKKDDIYYHALLFLELNKKYVDAYYMIRQNY